MPEKKDHIIHKTKTMVCGHQQTFSTPVPQEGNIVWCFRCNDYSKIPWRNRKTRWTVAEGRPRRLKSNPKSNNQYTKGRALS